MSYRSVELPVKPLQSLIYLLCAECDQLHYFRTIPFGKACQVRYNHPKAQDPYEFQTRCPSCLALQANDPDAIQEAFNRTSSDPHHEAPMRQVTDFTKQQLENAVPRQLYLPVGVNQFCRFTSSAWTRCWAASVR